MMQAMRIHQTGASDVFRREQMPMPEPGPGQVLIRVRASSVNPIDCKIRAGAVPALLPELPAVLHGDCSGEVAALGPGVTAFTVGDAVWTCGGGVRGHGGALAEYLLVDAALLAARPDSLDATSAAALPLVGITAWQLVERARIRPGDRVLVVGGTGGVGHVVVQLAARAGGLVTALVGDERKAALARELGADATWNHHQLDLPDLLTALAPDGFDVVIDTVGGEHLATSFAAAGFGARVATCAARCQVDLAPLHAKALDLSVVFMLLPLVGKADAAEHGRILQRLARLVDAGHLRPLLHERRFGMSEVAEAHACLEAGEAIGKIVLSADW